MRRRSGLRVAAASAAIAAAAASSYPSGIVVNPSNTPAYTYDNNPFRCVQPTVNVNVNSTHTWILVTSYSEDAADEVAGSALLGRSQFTFATFLDAVAYQNRSIWDPTDTARTPSLANLFTNTANLNALGLTSPSEDAFLWRGTCDATAVTDNVTYANSSTITLAPPEATGVKFTADLLGSTVQSAGCSCATYALTSAGVVDLTASSPITGGSYPCPTSTETTGSTNRIFYSVSGNSFSGRAAATLAGQAGITQSILTNRWNIRQSTCGATNGDSCSAGGFSGASTTADNTCSLKTEALLVLPTQQFVLQLAQNGALVTEATSTLTTHTWNMYTVEYASTAPAIIPPNMGVDQFKTRVTPSRFQLAVYPTGQVVQVLAIGDIAPGLLLHTSATGSMGNVVFAQRKSATSIRMTWQFDGYVQQANRYSLAVPPTAWDTKFLTSMAGMTPDLTVLGGGFTSVCSPWQNLGDNTPLAYSGSSYSCADVNCVPVGTSSLPFDLVSGLTQNQTSMSLYWTHYYMAVTCDITSIASLQLTDAFVLPASTLNVQYRLMNTSNVEITDAKSPPFSSISEVSYTSPGLQQPSVTFPLTARLSAIAESTIASASTLSDVVYSNEGQPALTGNLAYSQAFEYSVQFNDAATRKYWQVMPALVLMVAHKTTPLSNTPSSQTITTGSLPLSWCGLDKGSDIAGAWAIVDSAPTAGTSSNGAWLRNFGFNSSTGQLNRLGPIYNNIVNVLSPALQTAITELLTNNTLTSIDSLQSNLLSSSSPGGTQRVAVVTDSTGGFVVPMRNRFFIGGSVSGYQLSFCSLTQAVPYLPLAVDNMYPLYTTKDAALGDTLAISGVVADPTVVYGALFNDGGANNFIKYYLPKAPASTGGVVCMNSGRYTTLSLDNTPGATRASPDDTNSVCPGLIQAALQSMGGDFAQPPPAQSSSHRRMLMRASAEDTAAIANRASGIVIASAFSVDLPSTSAQLAYQSPPKTVKILPQRFDGTNGTVDSSPPPAQIQHTTVTEIHDDHTLQSILLYVVIGIMVVAVAGIIYIMFKGRSIESKIMNNEAAVQPPKGNGSNFAPRLVWSASRR